MSIIYETVAGVKYNQRVSEAIFPKANIATNGQIEGTEVENVSSSYVFSLDFVGTSSTITINRRTENPDETFILNIYLPIDGVPSGTGVQRVLQIGTGDLIRSLPFNITGDGGASGYLMKVDWSEGSLSSNLYVADGGFVQSISDIILSLRQQEILDTSPSTIVGSDELQVSQLPIIQIKVSTDLLGCNMGEVLMFVWSNITYIKGYPMDLVGYLDGATPPVPGPQSYIEYPNIGSVLRSDGKVFPSLLAHVKYLNETYPSGYTTPVFYKNLISYASARYMFMGLLNNLFSDKWMRRSYTTQFLSQMTNSEFQKYLVYFEEPQYDGIDSYFVC
jgi:hypothetical protein